MEKKCDGPKKPRITCTVHSPLMVSDLKNLFDCNGNALSTKPVMSLCRCGKSEKMPYCDGTHTKEGLELKKQSDRIIDRNKDYNGGDITVHFNLGVCSHDGSCLKLKPVFDRFRRPWILPDLGDKDAIIETIKKCPSGALSYTVDGECHKDFFDREPAIKVAKGGPLMVEGYVELKDDQNSCPESKEHYCLCRCGQSKNHPFCDGAHLSCGFYEEGR
ncbi:MAG TPA: CDGSH iron-sulfur domain-containing protein [bacterium]|nr:CDGSH iron-sulfur domain-containing protein [bacterium]